MEQMGPARPQLQFPKLGISTLSSACVSVYGHVKSAAAKSHIDRSLAEGRQLLRQAPSATAHAYSRGYIVHCSADLKPARCRKPWWRESIFQDANAVLVDGSRPRAAGSHPSVQPSWSLFRDHGGVQPPKGSRKAGTACQNLATPMPRCSSCDRDLSSALGWAGLCFQLVPAVRGGPRCEDPRRGPGKEPSPGRNGAHVTPAAECHPPFRDSI